MSPHGYEEIDHRADLALKVWGEDFTAVLHHAAEGMAALMEITYDVTHFTELSFSIPKGTQEEMLVDFLNEVLYLLEDKGMALSLFKVEAYESITISGHFHRLISAGRWIKAATFHNLAFQNHPGRIEATITFDV